MYDLSRVASLVSISKRSKSIPAETNFGRLLGSALLVLTFNVLCTVVRLDIKLVEYCLLKITVEVEPLIT